MQCKNIKAKLSKIQFEWRAFNGSVVTAFKEKLPNSILHYSFVPLWTFGWCFKKYCSFLFLYYRLNCLFFNSSDVGASNHYFRLYHAMTLSYCCDGFLVAKWCVICRWNRRQHDCCLHRAIVHFRYRCRRPSPFVHSMMRMTSMWRLNVVAVVSMAAHRSRSIRNCLSPGLNCCPVVPSLWVCFRCYCMCYFVKKKIEIEMMWIDELAQFGMVLFRQFTHTYLQRSWSYSRLIAAVVHV